jgi:CrcB protein
MTVLVATLLGSVGALARYAVAGAVQRRSSTTFPAGTAAVNLLGALSIGVVVGLPGQGSVLSVALLGFLGGFTTFSTWMVESLYLGIVPKPTLRAVANVLVVAGLGVALAAAGYHIVN